METTAVDPDGSVTVKMTTEEAKAAEPVDLEPDPEDCVDAAGDVRPEHDYDEYECRRCGAEDPDGVPNPPYDMPMGITHWSEW